MRVTELHYTMMFFLNIKYYVLIRSLKSINSSELKAKFIQSISKTSLIFITL